MHAVILGCGRVGSAISVDLAKAGHSVAVIDKRADAFDRLPPGFEAQTVVGVGFDRDVLEKAGIAKAAEDGAFIAVTNGDNSNIVSARIAREHFHVKRVIARIYDPRRAEIYEKLNIPTVASARWAASQIQFLLFHGKEELKESFAGGTLLHLQRHIPDHLVGRPASSVEAAGSVRIAGVDRGGKGFIPVEGSTFQQGDVAHFIVTTEGLVKLDDLMEPVAE